MEHTRISSVVAGLLIIAAGVLLCLFNVGVLPQEIKHLIFSFPSLMIAIGFVAIFTRHKRVFGMVMILIGGFFLQKKLRMPELDFVYKNIWAILLISIGVLVLCKAMFGRFNHRCRSFGGYDNKDNTTHNDGFGCNRKRHAKYHYDKYKHNRNNAGYISRNYVFGGSHERFNSDNFKGGEINCVFGGTELDLSNAKLAEGVNYMEVNLVFGGVVIYVPADWKIEVGQSQFCGRFQDNRPKLEFEVDENRTLILDVNAVFGGGEIKCR